MSIRTNLIVGVSCAVLAAGAFSVAGPLDPPAGPVAPTGSTLAEIRGAVDAIGFTVNPDPLDAVVYADTSSAPGSVHDGKPLTTAGLVSGACRLEVSGIGTLDFEIADLSSTIERIVVISGGGEMSRPGEVGYACSLIRSLSQSPGTTLNAWFEAVRDGQISNRNATLTLFDGSGNIVRQYTLFDTFPTAIDLRSADGELVEQLTLSVDRIELVN